VIICFIGDIFGQSGRDILPAFVSSIRNLYKPDFVIANGENAAAGRGITFSTADDILKAGVDAITLGNHTWSRKEVLQIIDSGMKIIRPANYPKGVPGKGRMIVEKNGLKLGLINLMGRVYVEGALDCPFHAADREISALKGQCDAILIDMHAEATSEKLALAMHVDGKVSAVIGTHTHVPTADERVLNKGTAFITDVGMTGPFDGIIGVDSETVLKKFTTGMPVMFEPATGRVQANAVIIQTHPNSQKADKIFRIQEIRS
jgi:metallophosphoesterase (TIGR00282 family)